jgi:hypothetical protein
MSETEELRATADLETGLFVYNAGAGYGICGRRLRGGGLPGNLAQHVA